MTNRSIHRLKWHPSWILKNTYFQTYLLGSASSKDYFLILLDELNAYTRGLITSVNLARFSDGYTVSARDGTSSLMSMTEMYVSYARVHEPLTWQSLQKPTVLNTVKILWSQAEDAMNRACPIPELSWDA